jgi:hypothetical protein
VRIRPALIAATAVALLAVLVGGWLLLRPADPAGSPVPAPITVPARTADPPVPLPPAPSAEPPGPTADVVPPPPIDDEDDDGPDDDDDD